MTRVNKKKMGNVVILVVYSFLEIDIFNLFNFVNPFN